MRDVWKLNARRAERRTTLFHRLVEYVNNSNMPLSYYDSKADFGRGYTFTGYYAENFVNCLMNTPQRIQISLAYDNYKNTDFLYVICEILPKYSVAGIIHGLTNSVAHDSDYTAAVQICEERLGKGLEYQVMAGK